MPLNRRRFLTALALLAGSKKLVSAADAGDAAWRKQRLELADRRRRIIYNDDGDARYQGYYGPAPGDVATFLEQRFNMSRTESRETSTWIGCRFTANEECQHCSGHRTDNRNTLWLRFVPVGGMP